MTLLGRTKCAIVGFCDTNRDLAPYENQEWEIWGLNRGSIFMHRSERWFDMHSPEIRRWEQRRPGKHELWLRSFPGPVYMHEADPNVPNSVAYPLEEVAEDLGANLFRQSEVNGPLADSKRWPYLTSSITYEIALAIHEGFEEIGLYGVDLNTSGEYAWQKASVEAMIGIAIGRGIKVILPSNCPLFMGNLYGRGFLKDGGEKLTSEQFDERLGVLKANCDEMDRKRHEIVGARRELMFLIEQIAPGLDHEKLDKRRQAMDNELANVESMLAQAHGSLKEALYWAHQTPDGQDPQEAIKQLDLKRSSVLMDAGGESSGIVILPDEGPMIDAMERQRELVAV